MAQKDSQQPLADELGTTETVSILQGGVLRRLLLTVLRARSSHTGTQAISTVSGLQAALDAKLDAEDYSDRFKGSYVSLAALEAAHPTAAAGDFAVVDTGAGAAPRQYLWDADTDEWAAGSDVAPANTDALAEGASNFWFTAARVRDTLMTGVSFLTATAVEATDSLLTAIGKLQAQIGALTGTVAAYADLPAAADNAGRERYVTAGRCWVRSNGTSWDQISVGEFTWAELRALTPANFPTGWRAIATDWHVPCHNTGSRIIPSQPFDVVNEPRSDLISDTTSLTAFVTPGFLIPGGLPGPRGWVEVRPEYTVVSSANQKNTALRISQAGGVGAGSVQWWSNVMTGVIQARPMIDIQNQNSAAAQRGGPAAVLAGIGAGSAAAVTATVNTDADWYITPCATPQNSGEAQTLAHIRITINPKA